MSMDYISYSQYNSYTSCPRSWYLGKLRNAEAKQTWYIPVGSAVHAMIEDHLSIRQHRTDLDIASAEHYFYPLIARQRLIEPDTSKWLAGGPKASPTVEEKALQLVKDCFERALEYLDEIDVWEVEYDASGSLPGLEVPLKAYIDIIGEDKKKKIPVIWDWKTGSTKPGNFQLETYKVLLETQAFSKKAGAAAASLVEKGRYIMLAPGKPVTRYVDLTSVEPVKVGERYQKVYELMQAKQYQAYAGFDCGFCFNQDNCLVNAGMTKRAVHYDRSEEDGYPF